MDNRKWAMACGSVVPNRCTCHCMHLFFSLLWLRFYVISFSILNFSHSKIYLFNFLLQFFLQSFQLKISDKFKQKDCSVCLAYYSAYFHALASLPSAVTSPFILTRPTTFCKRIEFSDNSSPNSMLRISLSRGLV